MLLPLRIASALRRKARCAFRANLRQPDHRLNGFELTEEGPIVVELVRPPVLEQPSRLWRDRPVLRIRQLAPLAHVPTQLVDGRDQLILLIFRRKPLAFIEHHVLLTACGLPLARLRNRRNKLSHLSLFDDLLSQLTLRIQLPMLRRCLIGRAQNRVLKNLLRHGLRSGAFCRGFVSRPSPAHQSASKEPSTPRRNRSRRQNCRVPALANCSSGIT